MKTFKQIIAEVEEPKSPDEKRFKDKHVIAKTADPAGNGDDVFKASNVKKDKSKQPATHEPGEDKEVYEETDLSEKKLTPAELKKREEIAKSIERDNPNMPMDKKMAIATATAKRVAEGDKLPFDPDPKKKSRSNSDGSKTSPMSRARQLAKQAIAKRNMKEEAELEEAVVHPDHISLHPHPTKKTHYVVGKVGKNVKGRLNPGEHVSDSEVDDLHDMGMKVKHERKPFKEEVQEADNFDRNFTKRIGATVRGGKGAEYLKKKAQQAQDQNRKLDPGAAKKGLGIGVTDAEKARQKAKKKGVQFPRVGVRTSPRTRVPGRLPESVEITEASAWSNAGRALNDYARKSGGIDKADFEKAAKFLYQIEKAGLMQKSTHLANFSKFVKDLDTDVREKVFSILKQNKLMESIEENVGAPQTAAHRRAQSGSRYSDLQKKVKLKGFGPDAAKGNMGNPSARAALKVKSEEVEEVDEAGTPERLAMIKKAAQKVNKEKKKAQRDAMKAIKRDPDFQKEELEEAVIDTLQSIVKTKGAKPVKFADGRTTKVDAYTASAMMNVYNNLNNTNKQKFADAINKDERMFMKMMDFAMQRVK